MVSFTIDADLVKAACECVASKRESVGHRAGLGCICFNGKEVIATDSYILFEGHGATGENLPEWLLLDPAIFSKARNTDKVTIEGEPDTLTITIEPRKGAKTVLLAKAEEKPFPRSYANLLDLKCEYTETWAFTPELMQKAMKASSKLRDRGIMKAFMHGTDKPLILVNDNCRFLIMNAKEV